MAHENMREMAHLDMDTAEDAATTRAHPPSNRLGGSLVKDSHDRWCEARSDRRRGSDVCSRRGSLPFDGVSDFSHTKSKADSPSQSDIADDSSHGWRQRHSSSFRSGLDSRLDSTEPRASSSVGATMAAMLSMRSDHYSTRGLEEDMQRKVASEQTVFLRAWLPEFREAHILTSTPEWLYRANGPGH